MGRLIIAEKHSVAQAIAAALGGGKAEDGWIGCGADAVTWAQGHLVDLLTPDEYQDRGWDKWSMDALPLDPTGGWKWKVNRQRGADRQYRVVAGLLKSDAYDVLVNACDPDREGESIFHRIVSYAGTRKPMLRLWVASLEEDAIRDALDSMRSEDEYRGLAEAADIRAKADWLIGMNASRAYTLVYHACPWDACRPRPSRWSPTATGRSPITSRSRSGRSSSRWADGRSPANVSTTGRTRRR